MNSEFIKRQKLLETPVEDLDLPIRASNCVRAAKIKTLGELINCTVEELAEHRNFGQKSISQVEQVLEEMGLKLKNKNDFMKVEFVSETSFQTIDSWYCIYVDGVYKTGSYHKENIEKIYNDIIANPNVLNKTKQVLNSAEIFVSSENIKTQ
jgi:hypothetical protein